MFAPNSAWRAQVMLSKRGQPDRKQAVALYDAYAAELAECDRQLESMLAALEAF